MEKITAAFHNRSDIEQAMNVLRQQGVIDIRVESSLVASDGMFPSLESNGIFGSAPIGRTGWLMHILVESSRLRQAEDTIAEFGGQW